MLENELTMTDEEVDLANEVPGLPFDEEYAEEWLEEYDEAEKELN